MDFPTIALICTVAQGIAAMEYLGAKYMPRFKIPKIGRFPSWILPVLVVASTGLNIALYVRGRSNPSHNVSLPTSTNTSPSSPSLEAGSYSAAPQTWTDPKTKLVWTKLDNGEDIKYPGAVDHCNALSAQRLAGLTGWRLPTIIELMGLKTTNTSQAVTVLHQEGPLARRVYIDPHITLTGFDVWAGDAGSNTDMSLGVSIYHFGGPKPWFDRKEYGGSESDKRVLCVCSDER